MPGDNVNVAQTARYVRGEQLTAKGEEVLREAKVEARLHAKTGTKPKVKKKERVKRGRTDDYTLFKIVVHRISSVALNSDRALCHAFTVKVADLVTSPADAVHLAFDCVAVEVWRTLTEFMPAYQELAGVARQPLPLVRPEHAPAMRRKTHDFILDLFPLSENTQMYECMSLLADQYVPRDSAGLPWKVPPSYVVYLSDTLPVRTSMICTSRVVRSV